jgi:LysM repeat protein
MSGSERRTSAVNPLHAVDRVSQIVRRLQVEVLGTGSRGKGAIALPPVGTSIYRADFTTVLAATTRALDNSRALLSEELRGTPFRGSEGTDVRLLVRDIENLALKTDEILNARPSLVANDARLQQRSGSELEHMLLRADHELNDHLTSLVDKIDAVRALIVVRTGRSHLLKEPQFVGATTTSATTNRTPRKVSPPRQGRAAAPGAGTDSEGETLLDISYYTGFEVHELRAANPELQGQPADVPLPLGFRLKLPRRRQNPLSPARAGGVTSPSRKVPGSTNNVSSSPLLPPGTKDPETLYELALAYDCSVDDIVALNPDLAGFGDDEILPQGAAIRLPPEAFRKLTGETLLEISATVGVPLSTLRDLNPELDPFEDDDVVPSGTQLRLPKPAPRGHRRRRRQGSDTVVRSESESDSTAGGGGGGRDRHYYSSDQMTEDEGVDTLRSLARAYDVSVAQIREANPNLRYMGENEPLPPQTAVNIPVKGPTNGARNGTPNRKVPNSGTGGGSPAASSRGLPPSSGHQHQPDSHRTPKRQTYANHPSSGDEDLLSDSTADSRKAKGGAAGTSAAAAPPSDSEATATLREIAVEFKIDLDALLELNPKLQRYELDEPLPEGVEVKIPPKGAGKKEKAGAPSKDGPGKATDSAPAASTAANTTTTTTTTSKTPRHGGSFAEVKVGESFSDTESSRSDKRQGNANTSSATGAAAPAGEGENSSAPETLNSIARTYNLTVEELRQANPHLQSLGPNEAIHVGTELRIPPRKRSATTTAVGKGGDKPGDRPEAQPGTSATGASSSTTVRTTTTTTASAGASSGTPAGQQQNDQSSTPKPASRPNSQAQAYQPRGDSPPPTPPSKGSHRPPAGQQQQPRGDPAPTTLQSLAVEYGVSVQQLKDENPHVAHLREGEPLPPNTTIRVPAKSTTQTPQGSGSDARPRAGGAGTPATTAEPSSSGSTVAPGPQASSRQTPPPNSRTLRSMSIQFGIPEEQLRRLNPAIAFIPSDQPFSDDVEVCLTVVDDKSSKQTQENQQGTSTSAGSKPASQAAPGEGGRVEQEEQSPENVQVQEETTTTTTTTKKIVAGGSNDQRPPRSDSSDPQRGGGGARAPPSGNEGQGAATIKSLCWKHNVTEAALIAMNPQLEGYPNNRALPVNTVIRLPVQQTAGGGSSGQQPQTTTITIGAELRGNETPQGSELEMSISGSHHGGPSQGGQRSGGRGRGDPLSNSSTPVNPQRRTPHLQEEDQRQLDNDQESIPPQSRQPSSHGGQEDSRSNRQPEDGSRPRGDSTASSQARGRGDGSQGPNQSPAPSRTPADQRRQDGATTEKSSTVTVTHTSETTNVQQQSDTTTAGGSGPSHGSGSTSGQSQSPAPTSEGKRPVPVRPPPSSSREDGDGQPQSSPPKAPSRPPPKSPPPRSPASESWRSGAPPPPPPPPPRAQEGTQESTTGAGTSSSRQASSSPASGGTPQPTGEPRGSSDRSPAQAQSQHTQASSTTSTTTAVEQSSTAPQNENENPESTPARQRSAQLANQEVQLSPREDGRGYLVTGRSFRVRSLFHETLEDVGRRYSVSAEEVAQCNPDLVTTYGVNRELLPEQTTVRIPVIADERALARRKSPQNRSPDRSPSNREEGRAAPPAPAPERSTGTRPGTPQQPPPQGQQQGQQQQPRDEGAQGDRQAKAESSTVTVVEETTTTTTVTSTTEAGNPRQDQDRAGQRTPAQGGSRGVTPSKQDPPATTPTQSAPAASRSPEPMNTLAQVSRVHNVTMSELRRLNPHIAQYADTEPLPENTELEIPDESPTPVRGADASPNRPPSRGATPSKKPVPPQPTEGTRQRDSEERPASRTGKPTPPPPPPPPPPPRQASEDQDRLYDAEQNEDLRRTPSGAMGRETPATAAPASTTNQRSTPGAAEDVRRRGDSEELASGRSTPLLPPPSSRPPVPSSPPRRQEEDRHRRYDEEEGAEIGSPKRADRSGNGTPTNQPPPPGSRPQVPTSRPSSRSATPTSAPPSAQQPPSKNGGGEVPREQTREQSEEVVVVTREEYTSVRREESSRPGQRAAEPAGSSSPSQQQTTYYNTPAQSQQQSSKPSTTATTSGTGTAASATTPTPAPAPRYQSIHDIALQYNVSELDIRKYNPTIAHFGSYEPLPPNTALELPPEEEEEVVVEEQVGAQEDQPAFVGGYEQRETTQVTRRDYNSGVVAGSSHPAEDEVYHVEERGRTLEEVARRFGVSVVTLRACNPNLRSHPANTQLPRDTRLIIPLEMDDVQRNPNSVHDSGIQASEPIPPPRQTAPAAAQTESKPSNFQMASLFYGIDEEELRRLNPDIAFQASDKPFPAGYKLRLPERVLEKSDYVVVSNQRPVQSVATAPRTPTPQPIVPPQTPPPQHSTLNASAAGGAASPTPAVVTRQGESLAELSHRYGVTVDAVQRANPFLSHLSASSSLPAGIIITLPDAAQVRALTPVEKPSTHAAHSNSLSREPTPQDAYIHAHADPAAGGHDDGGAAESHFADHQATLRGGSTESFVTVGSPSPPRASNQPGLPLSPRTGHQQSHQLKEVDHTNVVSTTISTLTSMTTTNRTGGAGGDWQRQNMGRGLNQPDLGDTAVVVADGVESVAQLCMRLCVTEDVVRALNPFLRRYHSHTIIPRGTTVLYRTSIRRFMHPSHSFISIEHPVKEYEVTYPGITLRDVMKRFNLSELSIRRMNPQLSHLGLDSPLPVSTTVIYSAPIFAHHERQMIRYNVCRSMGLKAQVALGARYFHKWRLFISLFSRKLEEERIARDEEARRLRLEVEANRAHSADLRHRITELRMENDSLRALHENSVANDPAGVRMGSAGRMSLSPPRTGLVLRGGNTPSTRARSPNSAYQRTNTNASTVSFGGLPVGQSLDDENSRLRNEVSMLKRQVSQSSIHDRVSQQLQLFNRQASGNSTLAGSTATGLGVSPTRGTSPGRPGRSPRRGRGPSLGLLLSGMRVVRSTGAAHAAGIRSNDLILAVDGKHVSNSKDFREAVQAVRGVRASLRIQRGDGTVGTTNVLLYDDVGSLSPPPPLADAHHSGLLGTSPIRTQSHYGSPTSPRGVGAGSALVGVGSSNRSPRFVAATSTQSPHSVNRRLM